MVITEAEVDRIARELIGTHGAGAARVAVERLNEMIDRGNIGGRDLWACVVHAIHDLQSSGPTRSAGSAGWTDPDMPSWHAPSRLDCAPFPPDAPWLIAAAFL